MRRVLQPAPAFAVALALAAAPSATLAWGGALRGDGEKVAQAREVGAFDRLRLEGPLDARVRVGGARSVSVTIDRNLQPRVTTAVEGTTLVVRTGEVSSRGEARVDVTVPALRGLSTEGSGDATIEGGQGDLALSVSGSGTLTWRGEAARLETTVSGSGDVRLTGVASTLRASVAGSGGVHARELSTRSAECTVAGSGGVEVTLTGGTLRAALAGSGDVIWHGEATVEAASTAGSGEIVHR